MGDGCCGLGNNGQGKVFSIASYTRLFQSLLRYGEMPLEIQVYPTTNAFFPTRGIHLLRYMCWFIGQY